MLPYCHSTVTRQEIWTLFDLADCYTNRDEVPAADRPSTPVTTPVVTTATADSDTKVSATDEVEVDAKDVCSNVEAGPEATEATATAPQAPAQSCEAQIGDHGDQAGEATGEVSANMAPPAPPEPEQCAERRSKATKAVKVTGDTGRESGGGMKAVTVTNLTDMFDEVTQDADGNEDGSFSQDLLMQRLNNFSLSTAYSGVGAPETTLLMIRQLLASRTATQLSQPELLHHIEWDQCCRSELLRYAELACSDGPPDCSGSARRNSHSCCCFGDLLDFFRPELREAVQQLQARPELAMEVLSRTVAEGGAVKPTAWCHAHQKFCAVSLGRTCMW